MKFFAGRQQRLLQCEDREYSQQWSFFLVFVVNWQAPCFEDLWGGLLRRLNRIWWKHGPSPPPLWMAWSEILCLKERPSVSAAVFRAFSFNCESLLYCQVLSVFSCLQLISAFCPSFLLPVCSKLPVCLSILHCFPHARRKRLNKSEGSLCIIGELEVFNPIKCGGSETKTQRNSFLFMLDLLSFQHSKSLTSGTLFKQNKQSNKTP